MQIENKNHRIVVVPGSILCGCEQCAIDESAANAAVRAAQEATKETS